MSEEDKLKRKFKFYRLSENKRIDLAFEILGGEDFFGETIAWYNNYAEYSDPLLQRIWTVACCGDNPQASIKKENNEIVFRIEAFFIDADGCEDYRNLYEKVLTEDETKNIMKIWMKSGVFYDRYMIDIVNFDRLFSQYSF